MNSLDASSSRGIDVVRADVADAHTLPLYRRLLPGLLVVKLDLSLGEARRRAASRSVYLTLEEFDALHGGELRNLVADHVVDVGGLTLEEQCEAVRHLWHR